jgi:NADH:ubiquinone oxidoreductase subunit E
VDVNASFCFEKCEHGPTVCINGQKHQHCTSASVRTEIRQRLEEKP